MENPTHPVHPSEKLTCLSVIICDQVIEDARSHNRSLINLFNTVFATQMPFILPNFAMMVSVTNIRVETTLMITIKDPELRTVFEASGSLNSNDPTGIVDLVLEVRNMRLECFGTHFLDVRAYGELLSGRRFEVVPAPPMPPPGDQMPGYS